MFERVGPAWRYARRIGRALFITDQRKLLWRMLGFSHKLPQRFDRPLPQMMAELTPSTRAQCPVDPDEIRPLADAVAAWHLYSPLGICLRRSLLRYYFLREAGLPVTIIFGARLKREEEGGGIGGHAWLTLNGRPYFERPGNYEGFARMYVYPEPEAAS